MNISDMVFTDEDREKLIENRKKIFDWIKENIISQLTEDDKITIDYGGTYMGMRSYESTTNYHLVVFGKKSSVYYTSERYEGYIGIGEKYGDITRMFDDAESPRDIYPVIDNWELIKNTLLKEVAERREKKKIIYEFKI